MENPFRVLGAEAPTMLGRRETLARIWTLLEGKTLEHVSVVGPAMYGKSVLLREVARRYAAGRPGYTTAVYLDMAHHTPGSDAEVRRRFLNKLRSALSELRPEIVEYLSIEDVAPRERLQLVSHELESKGDTLLVVVDNFDDVLASPGITRELLDDMRMAASRPTLRFVCGSRRPLRELCGADESHPSDFWKIFHDAPVVVGCFSPTGWEDLFAPFAENGVEVEPEARDEIVRWTGGVPVLAAAFLQALYDGVDRGAKVSIEHASRVGERVLDERRQLLTA
jgi:hypothetical protein